MRPARMFAGSRAFSQAWLPQRSGKLDYFSMLSWNCRALLHRDEKKMRRKVAELRSMAKSIDIICLQEVHGARSDVLRVLNLFFLYYFWICTNPGIKHAVGGLVTLFSRASFPDGWNIVQNHLAAGRNSRFCVEKDGRKAIYWNVHNQELTDAVITQVNTLLTADRN